MVLLAIDPGIRGCGVALFVKGRLVAAAYVKSPVRAGSGPWECFAAASAVRAWAMVALDQLLADGVLTEPAIDQFVAEWPQTYGGRAAAGDANDLFPLAGVVAALATLMLTERGRGFARVGADAVSVSYFSPHDWKGGVQKPDSVSKPYPIEGKVRARLDSAEVAALTREWPSNVRHTWDVTDAVGVGLKQSGRFERQRAYARS